MGCCSDCIWYLWRFDSSYGHYCTSKNTGNCNRFREKGASSVCASYRNFGLRHLSFFSYTAHSISSLRTFRKGQHRDFFSVVWSYLFFAGDVSLFQPRQDIGHFGRISHSYPTDNHFNYHFRSGIFC